MKSSPIVTVSDLRKSYDGKEVVKGISFEVGKGEIFGILGPNGAGKTTTLEMIEALRPIDGGSAVIDGIDVAKDPYGIRNIIGVQPHHKVFYGHNDLPRPGAGCGVQLAVQKYRLGYKVEIPQDEV